MTIRASFDNIVATRLPDDERRSAGGIELPGGPSKGVPWKVLIQDVGPGRISPMSGELIETRYEKGDTVYVPPFSDYVVPIRGTDYIICAEGKILAYVTDEDKS